MCIYRVPPSSILTKCLPPPLVLTAAISRVSCLYTDPHTRRYGLQARITLNADQARFTVSDLQDSNYVFSKPGPIGLSPSQAQIECFLSQTQIEWSSIQVYTEVCKPNSLSGLQARLTMSDLQARLTVSNLQALLKVSGLQIEAGAGDVKARLGLCQSEVGSFGRQVRWRVTLINMNTAHSCVVYLIRRKMASVLALVNSAKFHLTKKGYSALL